MPNPARLVVYGTDNKPLAGPIPIEDTGNANLTGSEVHEFSHQVYTIEKDYFYSLLYGVDFVRQHKPLVVFKPVDKTSIYLRSFIVKGIFLPKVEVRWYTYLDDMINMQEYFRVTMEHVRLNDMVMILPDVKDHAFELYEHLEKLSFCYQKITWLYKKGNLEFTDIWNGGFFLEEDEKDFSGTQSDETDLEEGLEAEGALKVTFTSGIFDVAPEDVAFDTKVKVKFTADFSREANMKERKVYAKLFAVCNGKTEDLRLVQEGRLSEDGEWTTTFTLKKPEVLANSDGAGEQVEYYAEIENSNAASNFKSESIKTPSDDQTVIYLTDVEGAPLVGIIADLVEDETVLQQYESDSEGKIIIESEMSKSEYTLILRKNVPSAEEPGASEDEKQKPMDDGAFVDVGTPVETGPDDAGESIVIVRDETDEPIPGIVFDLLLDGSKIGSFETDQEGTFVIPFKSGDGNYEILFQDAKDKVVTV